MKTDAASMQKNEGFLLAACHEITGSGDDWYFHFINATDNAVEKLILLQVDCEWGDISNTNTLNIELDSVPAGCSVLAWRDTSDIAELRSSFLFIVKSGGITEEITFEFPKLYIAGGWEFIPVLGKKGYISAGKIT